MAGFAPIAHAVGDQRKADAFRAVQGRRRQLKPRTNMWPPSLGSVPLMMRFLLLLGGSRMVLASWQPRPLAGYAVETLGRNDGVRRFRHHEAHRHEDGSDLSVSWTVEADPTTIVSLDVDSVQVLKCEERRLALEIVGEDEKSVERWLYIVGSDSLHGCAHLGKGEHLYRRVVAVERIAVARHLQSKGPPNTIQVTLATEELQSPAQIFHRVDFSFRYVPRDAKDPDQLQSAEPTQNFEAAARRLQNLSWDTPTMDTTFIGPNGMTRSGEAAVGEDGLPDPKSETVDQAVTGSLVLGRPQSVVSFAPDQQKANSIIDFHSPSAFSRLGWNWDYKANCTKNPEFEFMFPGGEGWLRLYKPYLKAHVALTVNFSSELPNLNEPPHVRIVAKLDGVATVNLDLATSVDFDDDAAVNPLSKLELPFIGSEKVFMKPLRFYLGGTPLQFDPGFSCHLNAYHVGEFKGSLRVSLNTKLKFSGLMTFDTATGLRTNVSATASDVTFTPPTWMVFTKHFELGAMLEPEIWLKGGVGLVKDMQLGMGLRPYVNVSIMQKGQEASGATPSSPSNTLAVYPYRVAGLPRGSYSIRLGANGVYRSTSSQLSLAGVVEFDDKVENFDFGGVSEQSLLQNSIEVQLLKNGKQPPVATASVRCFAVSSGECSPGPAMPLQVPIAVEGSNATVFLSTAWMPDPVSYIVAKVKGMSFIVLKLSVVDNLLDAVTDPDADIHLQMERNGQSCSLPMTVQSSSSQVILNSTAVCDMGLRFLDSSKSKTLDELKLVVNKSVVASGPVPAVQWRQPWHSGGIFTAVTDMLGVDSTQTLSVDVALRSPRSSDLAVYGAIALYAVDAAEAAHWILPYQADTWRVGEVHTIYWTTRIASSLLGKMVGYPGTMAFNLSTISVASDDSLVPNTWNTTFNSKCNDSDVQSYTYADTPTQCIFSCDFEVPMDLAGQQVMLVVNWMGDSDRVHNMMSSAITLAYPTTSLFELVGPEGGNLFSKSGVARHLDIAWSNSAGTQEEEDRQRVEQYGVKRARIHRRDEPGSVSLSVVSRSDGRCVYSHAEIPTRSCWARIPGTVVRSWDDGDYDVKLRWFEKGAEQESSREIRVCSGCAAEQGAFLSMPRADLLGQPRHLAQSAWGWSKAATDANGSSANGLGWNSSAGGSSEEDFRDHVAASSQQCTETPLVYSVGVGCMQKSDMRNMILPLEVPFTGGQSIAPNFQSVSPLVESDTNAPLADLLPKSVCSDGLCSGEMPGCKPHAVSPIRVKQIEFNLSRKFLITDLVDPSLRQALAYGLAVLPDVVEVAGKEIQDAFPSLTRVSTTTTTTGTTTTVTSTSTAVTTATTTTATTTSVQPRPTSPPTSAPTSATPSPWVPVPSGSSTSAPRSATVLPTPVSAPSTPETPAPSPSSARSLHEDGDWVHSMDTSGAESGDGFETDTLVVRITKPVLYEISQSHLQRLVDVGAFGLVSDKREATHGPVSIVSAKIRESSELAGVSQDYSRGSYSTPRRGTVRDFVAHNAAVASTALFAAVAAVVLAWRVGGTAPAGPQHVGYTAVANPGSGEDQFDA